MDYKQACCTYCWGLTTVKYLKDCWFLCKELNQLIWEEWTREKVTETIQKFLMEEILVVRYQLPMPLLKDWVNWVKVAWLVKLWQYLDYQVNKSAIKVTI